eukprot:Awhi_evm2s12919
MSILNTLKQNRAVIVDDQNASDKNYKRMSDDYDNNLSFQASRDLVFRGLEIMN